MLIECIYCGFEFEAETGHRKICDDCFDKVYKLPKPPKKKPNPNEKLMEDVREAAKHNLSYGQWKGRKP